MAVAFVPDEPVAHDFGNELPDMPIHKKKPENVSPDPASAKGTQITSNGSGAHQI